MSEEAQLILNAMQSAVIEELQRKAKLGYKAVIAGRRGEAKVVSAPLLYQHRHWLLPY